MSSNELSLNWAEFDLCIWFTNDLTLEKHSTFNVNDPIAARRLTHFGKSKQSAESCLDEMKIVQLENL